MGARQRFLIGAISALLASAAIVVSGRLDLAPNLVNPVATLVGTATLVATFGPARGGLASLILMSALNRYTAEVGGASLKPEHIAALMVAVVLLARWRSLIRNLRAVDLLLLGWLGWSVVGGLLNAPDPADSTKLWAMLLLVAFPYFVIVTTVRTAGRMIAVVDWWMLVSIAVGLFGIATHLLYAWEINLGIQINPVTADPTVPSTFRESNLFGSAMMILVLAALGMLLFEYRRGRLAAMAAVVGFIGLQVSFTRTAWIALVLGVWILGGTLVILAVRNVYRISSDVLRPIVTVLIVGVVVTTIIWLPTGDSNVRDQREKAVAVNATREAQITATLPPLQRGTPTILDVPTIQPENPDLSTRLESVSDGADESVSVRLKFAQQGLKDWREHPFTGLGIGSFGQTYTTTSYDRAWLSNTFVRTLHDGGIVGLALFLTPLALLALAGLRLTDQISGDLDRLALALGVAVAGMFVAFQATEGFQLAWYWAIVGLYAAAVRLAHERRAGLT